MNKIFKIIKRTNGTSIVASELAKGSKKGTKVAAVIMSALFAGTTFATPAVIQGTATSENAVSIGSDSYATAIDGVANGNSSIATGNGFSREDFAQKMNEQNTLLNDKATKQNELDSINTNLAVNDKAQEDLGKQITDLTNLVNSKEQKSDQLEKLNDQLFTKNDDLSKLNSDLDEIKNRLPNEYLTGENKNVAVDFTPILNSLNYDKLNDNNGRNELTQDLKNKLETDFPDIKGTFTDKQYLDVLNEFISKRSSYDAYRNVYDAEMGNNKYKNISVDNINSGLALENMYLRHGETIKNTSLDNIYSRLENDKNNHVYATFHDNTFLADKKYSKDYWNRYSSMQSNLYDQLIISHLVADSNTSTHFIANQYTNGNCNSFGGTSSDCQNTKLNYVFKLAPLNETYNDKNRFKFINKYVNQELKGTNYVTGISAVVQRIVTDKALSNDDLEFIKYYYDKFNTYSNSIDYNSDKWVVDKENYRANLQKVLDFNAKLEEYRQVSEKIRADAANGNVQDSLLARQINLKKEIESLNIDSSYFESMQVSFNQNGKNEVNKGVDYVIQQENFIDKNLRYYDGKNIIITKVQEKVKDVQKDVNDVQKAIDEKQKEIDEINQQIKDLALTPDEKAASDLKAEKERELADKKTEKTQLEENKAKKQNELDEINRQLANSGLKDLGLHSQAYGSNAFASGNDSIAIGTNSTVTSHDGIVIGRDSTVTGIQSLSIGTNNTVASAQAVALGNNISIGAGFDGIVVLGDNSTTANVNPTQNTIIRGETFTFAGTNPVSTLSIGSVGAERQIANVAAGRLSASSTDAINGSQLYAVVDAVNKLELGAVNPKDVSDAIQNAISNNLKAGQNITIDETANPDDGSKTFTINAIVPKTPMTKVSTGAGLAVTSSTTTDPNGETITDYHITTTGNSNGITVEESVSAGSQNVLIRQDGLNESGGKNFIVDLANNLDLTDKGSVKLGDVLIANHKINMGGNTVSNIGTPIQATDATTKDYVDHSHTTLGSQDSTVVITQSIMNATTGATHYDLSVKGIDKGIYTKTDDGKSLNYKLGETISLTGDNKNISTSTTTNGKVSVKLADDLRVDSVTAGNVFISTNGVNAGNQKVTQVANGDITATSRDAVNGSQLYATHVQVNQNTHNIVKLDDRVNYLDNKLNRVNKDLRAGIAGTAAIAGLPQVRGHGKSMVSAAAGNYKGQSAIAVGYSKASDNGKLLLKVSGSANTQGDIVSSVGIGYEW